MTLYLNKPLVNICISTYNKGEYIKQTLNSLVNLFRYIRYYLSNLQAIYTILLQQYIQFLQICSKKIYERASIVVFFT